jgi:hypothetical protein
VFRLGSVPGIGIVRTAAQYVAIDTRGRIVVPGESYRCDPGSRDIRCEKIPGWSQARVRDNRDYGKRAVMAGRSG